LAAVAVVAILILSPAHGQISGDDPNDPVAGLLQMDPEIEAMNQKARQFFKEEKYLEAAPLTEKVYELTKHRQRDKLVHQIALINLRDVTRAILKKSLTLYNAENYPEALPHLEEGVRLLRKLQGPEDERKLVEGVLARAYEDTTQVYLAYMRRVGELISARDFAEAEENARILVRYGRALRNYAANMYGDALTRHAEVFLERFRFRDALPLFKEAVEVFDAYFTPEADPTRSFLANRHHRLAEIYFALDEYGLAEQHHKHALELRQLAKRPHPRQIGFSLNRLGLLYLAQRRPREAEGLFAAALKLENPAPTDVGDLSNNLGLAYANQQRLDEAEAAFRRALEADKRVYGDDHPEIATILDNMAGVSALRGRSAEEESYVRRALAIREKHFGKDSPSATLSMHNLAHALLKQERLDEAKTLLERSLSVRETFLGDRHSLVSVNLGLLGHIAFRTQQWALAYQHFSRASSILIENGLREARSLRATGVALQRSQLDEAWNSILGQIVAGERLQHLPGQAPAQLRNETFRVAQFAQGTAAGAALASMAARHGAPDANLTKLIRERQDLIVEWKVVDQKLTEATAQSADPRENAQQQLRSRRLELDARIAEIDSAIARGFPKYAAYANPDALGISDVQQLLAADEALIQFIHVPRHAGYSEAVFVWVVTPTDAQWSRVDPGNITLHQRVETLRCGLDQSGEWQWSPANRWVARRAACRALRPDGFPASEGPPFDLEKSHELYKLLLGGLSPLLRTSDGRPRHLLVVPSGPLTQLPFQVLVTERTDAKVPASQKFVKAAWLGRLHAVTVLPSVASLRGLRADANPGKGSKPFIGFGNPLLVGDPAKLTRSQRRSLAKRVGESLSKQSCVVPMSDRQTNVGWRVPDFITKYFRGELADAEKVRQLDPLPETADELCTIAQTLSVPASDIYLGQNATEASLRKLNAEGMLETYRIVHFATHGLVASETKTVANAFAEPALVLTPPAVAGKEDDGLLTASEVTQLKLDADWIVLSACNSAAGGEKSDAEALSGLARAFFYAGARAMLVSHWYVDSHMAVKITTMAFAELKRDPGIGRAEALKRAILAAMTDTSRPAHWVPAAHPAMWAPFVVVGEGGAGR
jgi:CHAT domain-containing protein/tetratricopeptide (TPR) repeat protein